MARKADTRIPSGVQAKQAFSEYAALVRRHAEDPDIWDTPKREKERRAAHARFLELFEVGQ